MDFEKFPKMARISRKIIITEKLDGTNAQIAIGENGEFQVGSRNRWITPEDDNYGFAAWAYDNRSELMELGPGRHFGEWWGQGIQRRYDMDRKVFSLFNVARWEKERPACCDIVPVLYDGMFSIETIESCLSLLGLEGSRAAPGFMNPEGIIIFHIAANIAFKKTLLKDEIPKSVANKVNLL